MTVYEPGDLEALRRAAAARNPSTALQRQRIARAMTEDDLLEAVVAAAGFRGWHVHHSRPARTAQGWRTALVGNPGLPDLVLAHPRHGVLFRELKSMRGTLDDDQRGWLDALTNGGANVAVWRPSDWVDGLIDLELSGAHR